MVEAWGGARESGALAGGAVGGVGRGRGRGGAVRGQTF